jgi:hypothetical protein
MASRIEYLGVIEVRSVDQFAADDGLFQYLPA